MTDNNLPQQSADDEIDLRELFAVIWDGKWIIIVTTFVFAVTGVFYALSLPNIYKSDVLLAPVAEDSGLSIPGQLGGLAALAGVNLGGGGGKTELALQILKSREFLGRFIERHDLFIPLMAAEGWNRSDNSLVLDDEVFDMRTQEWIRKVAPPFLVKPSTQEAYREFAKLLSVSQDQATGMVYLSISHYSPFLAKEWANLLVRDINDEMRNREVSEAQNSISYLNSQIEQTDIADVRAMLFSLIEDQSKTLMLANVREEYVFKTVDPAVIADRKAKPARMVICILAVLFGGILAVLGVLVRYVSKRGSKT